MCFLKTVHSAGREVLYLVVLNDQVGVAVVDVGGWEVLYLVVLGDEVGVVVVDVGGVGVTISRGPR